MAKYMSITAVATTSSWQRGREGLTAEDAENAEGKEKGSFASSALSAAGGFLRGFSLTARISVNCSYNDCLRVLCDLRAEQSLEIATAISCRS